MPTSAHSFMTVLATLATASCMAIQVNPLTIKGRPIVTVSGVLSAHFNARRMKDGKELSQVVVTLNRSNLNQIDLDDVTDGGSWWLWKGTQDSSGNVKPATKAIPDHPIKVAKSKTGDTITLDIDAQIMGLANGDSLLVFLTAKSQDPTDSQPIAITERGLSMTVSRPPAIDSITVTGLAFVPNEQLENGTSELVVHSTLTYDRPDLHANLDWTRLHFYSTNVLSTAATDESAYFSGTLLAEKIRRLDDIFQTIPLSPFVRLDSSESFQNQSASIGIVGKVRLRGTRFGMGEDIDSSRDAMLYLIPIQFQDRFHRSGYVAPWDTRANILVSSANFLWEPIFLWSPRQVPDINKDYSLHLSGNIWYFPDRDSAPGVEVKRFESRADVEIQIPFVKLRIQKPIPIPLRLTVAIGTGAVPSNGYVQTTSVSLGVKTSF